MILLDKKQSQLPRGAQSVLNGAILSVLLLLLFSRGCDGGHASWQDEAVNCHIKGYMTGSLCINLRISYFIEGNYKTSRYSRTLVDKHVSKVTKLKVGTSRDNQAEEAEATISLT